MRPGIRVLMAMVVFVASACSSDSATNPPDKPITPPPPETPAWTDESCPAGVRGDTLHVQLYVRGGDSFAIGDTLTMNAYVTDPTGYQPKCNVILSSSDTTHIKVVGGSKVAGVGLGTATITGRAPNASSSFSLTVVATAPSFAPRHYALIDLRDGFRPVRMNERRQLLLVSNAGNVLWDNGAITILDGCPTAHDLNDNGVVLCRNENNVSLWQKGVMTPVTALRNLGNVSSLSLELNDAGTIAGWMRTFTPSEAFVFRVSGDTIIKFVNRLNLQGTQRLNNRGQLLAFDFLEGYSRNNYLFDTTFATLDVAGMGLGLARDVNDNGTIVGTAESHNHAGLAVIQNHGSMTEIAFGSGNSINNKEQVVGYLTPPTDPREIDLSNLSFSGPFIWDRATGVQLLRRSALDANWAITDALQIIDDGTVLARADNESRGFSNHLVLLTPVSR